MALFLMAFVFFLPVVGLLLLFLSRDLVPALWIAALIALFLALRGTAESHYPAHSLARRRVIALLSGAGAGTVGYFVVHHLIEGDPAFAVTCAVLIGTYEIVESLWKSRAKNQPPDPDPALV